MLANRTFVAFSLLSILVGGLAPRQAAADMVLNWNQVATDVLVANTSLQNPGMASRSLAMMNIAIYDGVNSMTPGAELFYNYGAGHSSPGLSGSAEAAAAQAAYTVLSAIYPDQQPMLDAALATSLGMLPDDAARAAGVAQGAFIGQRVVNHRRGDGYDSLSQYTPTFEPGRWQPDPLNPTQEAWGPAWGSVTPFALETNTQFMPPPSPDLTSEEYADAFDEVLQLGSVDSTERTADQTQIGLFWAYDREGLGTPMRLYNNIMREIADQEGNSMHENAEMFALASVAMADAGIVAWNAKFEYDLWRPVTGIRQADEDGNGLTMADPDWTPLGAPGGAGTDFTPPFPTYISGHATFGGAMFAALAEFFGDDNIAFTIGSEELPGVERSFTSLSEAMAENGRSRVYLGIHWNYDDTVGQETGAQIAQYISSGLFRASAPEPATAALLAAVAPVVLAARRRCA